LRIATGIKLAAMPISDTQLQQKLLVLGKKKDNMKKVLFFQTVIFLLPFTDLNRRFYLTTSEFSQNN